LNQRPELTKGTVEFVAPAEYMVRPPMPPVYFFLIDVSISAVRSGMIEVSTSLLAQCIACTAYPISAITVFTFIHEKINDFFLSVVQCMDLFLSGVKNS
jgi:protein transport protein SEC24